MFKRFFSVMILVVGFIFGVSIFFLSTGFPGHVSEINSSFVRISDSGCASCSAYVPNYIYSLILRNGYKISTYPVSFGTKMGYNIISNDLITSLPSVVMPEDSRIANLITGLVYLNIFDVESNGFVLNTPFLSGLTGNVTFFNLVSNNTIRDSSVYNVSEVFNLSKNSSYKAYLNPMQFLFLQGTTNISVSGLPAVVYVYTQSPFSAIQSMIMKSALGNFGNFSSDSFEESGEIGISSNESLGPLQFYNLQNMTYTSSYFHLSAFNLSSVSSQKIKNLIFEYDQNAILPVGQSYGNFMPFMDIGGRFISVSSMLRPNLFNDMSVNEINSYIADNSSVRKVFSDSVYFLDALLCSYAVNANVCSSPQVIRDEYYISTSV
ncbi:hypothetical protein M1293_02390 [Candidatus Parvarchaeota archaeon]|nr:hypothetical protein [Candidatus Parvarchaeota archaeon]